MFFSIPATGKARDRKPKEVVPQEEPKEKPQEPRSRRRRLARRRRATLTMSTTRLRRRARRRGRAVPVDAARPRGARRRRGAAEAPGSGRRRRRPVCLPPDGQGQRAPDLFEGLGVLQSIKRCATGASSTGARSLPSAALLGFERALERSGRALGGKAVTVARSMRTGKQAEHDDDGGGAVFDQLNNRLYPHDIPEAHLDFKKRRIMYPKDHDR